MHRTSVQSFALGDDSVHAARMDLIRVVGLELRCIVGVRSYERRREQPLRVDIALGLDLSTAGRSGLIGDSVDYSEVADGITALLRFREYRLLEVAAEEASALLFAAYPAIGHVSLRLDKPEALAGRARCASVEVVRTRGAFGATEELTEYGARTELFRGAEAIIERLRIDPGRSARVEDAVPRLENVNTPGHQHFAQVPAGERSTFAADQTPLVVVRCLALPRA